MDPWRHLPDLPLAAGAPVGAALRVAGLRTLRAAGHHVARLPYGRLPPEAPLLDVVRLGRGTCSTKHALIAAAAAEIDAPVELVVGIYEMSEANTPGVGPVLEAAGLASIPEAHCVLRVGEARVDLTRAGVTPAEPIGRFAAERVIGPGEIGAVKVAFHREHLRAWLADRPPLGFDEAALWSVREACIAALAQG